MKYLTIWCEGRDLSCSHSNGDIFTCEDNMLFSHVKISSFRAKAHLVFLWCLHNNIFSPVPLLESRNVVPKSNFVFLSRFDSIVFSDKTKQHFLLPAPIKREILTSREGLYKSRLRDLHFQSIKIKQ